jgi:hypothetical protein
MPDAPTTNPAPGGPPDPDDDLQKRLEWFARWSDDVYRIPGTSIRVGLEPLLGLIPVLGDAAGVLVAAYVPFEAWRHGAPRSLLWKMTKTLAIDGLVGLIPVLGDVFDVTYRANRRNATRLIEWLEAQHADRPADASPPANAPEMDTPEPRTEPKTR